MIELQADLEYVVSDRLKVSLDAIAQFCQRWNIVEFALFGSVLRDDFRPDSDVDVLVTYEPSHRLTLSHLLGMQEEIEHLFHRPVDLVEKKQLKNPYRRSNAPGTRSLDGKQERERQSAGDIAIIYSGRSCSSL
ncbi:nucleotidyltransferase family protein [Microcoleus sp. F10-C6]|uniref:nucleotidyltransferase family protein n=1 Tax=unclassified Microcoleus TaxID=2642155 RepID=UPI002FD2B5D7